MEEPPVRLCCLQRHVGRTSPDGPDGKVMCCLCFERFNVEDLHVNRAGLPEDICEECHRMDQING